jgi:OPT family small oligopeptide transporter
MGTVVGYPTNLTWWAYIVSMVVAWIFFMPIGIIQGATNVAIGLNVVTEFMVGYMLPGRPLAMMLFKAYGYMALYQGLAFTGDLKLAQYMKVPPRTVFMGQVISTVWSSIVQIAVMNWAFGAIDNICAHDQVNHFTCPGGEVFFNASVIWGLIGPSRIFGIGALYSPMLWFFLVGAICPVITWYLARKYPRSLWKYVNMPIIFGGSGMIPPATALNYLSWGIVGFIFNKFIRNKWRGWWMHYNYVTSAGMDVGLALSTIIIFFTLSLTGTNMTDWWGSTTALNTMDYMDTAVIRTVAPGEIFGPTTW